MQNKMSDTAFWVMANMAMPLRNLFMPPKSIFDEIEIHSGQKILDFGCGPGTFTLMAAQKAGPEGIVYAVDIHPLALRMTEKRARNKGLVNIEYILTDCHTPFSANSLDAIILIDVFHMIENQKEVLNEIVRVLKPGKKLFFSDHHMKRPCLNNHLITKKHDYFNMVSSM
jgi:ubiquinone/menaquinone biosynthesis C-methylase UbiE